MNILSFVKKIFQNLLLLKSWLIEKYLNQVIEKTKLKKFNDFNFNLGKMTNTPLVNFFHLRFYEIDFYIKKYKIKKVIEIGSGRTTFLFNEVYNLNCVSYEQDEVWKSKLLKSSKWNPTVEIKEVENYKNGAKFKDLNDLSCDMLYIDGPYIPHKRNKNTLSGKPAYYDFETILAKKLPKIILIDIRTDTVDSMLESKLLKKYNFIGGFRFCIERRKLGFLKLKYHSVFIKKGI